MIRCTGLRTVEKRNSQEFTPRNWYMKWRASCGKVSKAKEAELAMLSGSEGWLLTLSPINHSNISQSWVSESSRRLKRADRAFLWVCYSALWSSTSTSLKNCSWLSSRVLEKACVWIGSFSTSTKTQVGLLKGY